MAANHFLVKDVFAGDIFYHILGQFKLRPSFKEHGYHSDFPLTVTQREVCKLIQTAQVLVRGFFKTYFNHHSDFIADSFIKAGIEFCAILSTEWSDRDPFYLAFLAAALVMELYMYVVQHRFSRAADIFFLGMLYSVFEESLSRVLSPDGKFLQRDKRSLEQLREHSQLLNTCIWGLKNPYDSFRVDVLRKYPRDVYKLLNSTLAEVFNFPEGDDTVTLYVPGPRVRVYRLNSPASESQQVAQVSRVGGEEQRQQSRVLNLNLQPQHPPGQYLVQAQQLTSVQYLVQTPQQTSVQSIAQPPPQTSVQSIAQPPSQTSVQCIAQPPQQTSVQYLVQTPQQTTVQSIALPPQQTTVQSIALPPQQTTVQCIAQPPQQTSVQNIAQLQQQTPGVYLLQLPQLTPAVCPGHQLQQVTPAVCPGRQLQQVTPAVCPGRHLQQVTPAVCPGRQLQQVTPAVCPGHQPQQVTPAVCPGHQPQQVTPAVCPGHQPQQVTPAVCPGHQPQQLILVVCHGHHPQQLAPAVCPAHPQQLTPAVRPAHSQQPTPRVRPDRQEQQTQSQKKKRRRTQRS